jgi:phosphoenolpyruvate carboxylase
MASLAFKKWRTQRMDALNEIESVYHSLAGTGSRRRATMQQLNQAYTLLLSSEFQGFCRNLHTECAAAVARILPSTHLQNLMRDSLVLSRKLDAGNANPGNIGADFNRFDLSFWSLVDTAHPQNARRHTLLEQLNRWRNAIAHNAFEPGMLRGSRLALSRADVRRWRKACDGLARWFDRIMRDRLRVIIGANPW